MAMKTKSAPKLPFEMTEICFGTSGLGNMPDTYGYEVSEERALDTVRAIFEQTPCFLDSSRNYGFGRSEERVGMVIRERGGLPEGCVLSTKLDRGVDDVLDAARARRSLEESLTALGLDRIDILHLHDPEHCASLEPITKTGGALDELFKMKEEGIVGAVGLAMGDLEIMTAIMPDWDFDTIISHNRFTLINRSADALFSDAHERGIAVFNAAPYASGVLAKGTANSRRMTYQDASDEQLEPVRRVEAVCARHGIPVGAAALQFSMRDTRITSTICGVSKPERVHETLDWAAWEIPEAAWDELMALPFGTDDPEATRVYKPG